MDAVEESLGASVLLPMLLPAELIKHRSVDEEFERRRTPAKIPELISRDLRGYASRTFINPRHREGVGRKSSIACAHSASVGH